MLSGVWTALVLPVVTRADHRIAALERAREIKPSDVEEVFFGNVISAGQALLLDLLCMRSR